MDQQGANTFFYKLVRQLVCEETSLCVFPNKAVVFSKQPKRASSNQTPRAKLGVATPRYRLVGEKKFFPRHPFKRGCQAVSQENGCIQ